MTMTTIARELGLSVSRVSRLIARVEQAKGKTSYLAKADHIRCSDEVEPVGQDDAGKT